MLDEELGNTRWNLKLARKIYLRWLRGERPYVTLSAGFTPSGYMHIGTYREVALTDFVGYTLFQVFRVPYRFLVMIDDMDTSTRVIDAWKPYLPEESVGTSFHKLAQVYPKYKPIWEEVMEVLNFVRKELPVSKHVLVSNLYYRGLMNKYIDLSIKRLSQIRQSLEGTKSDAKVFMPVYAFDKSYRLINKGRYKNLQLVSDKKYDLLDGKGKLQWRLDWAAKWHLFNVDFEPCGKDHMTSSVPSTVWNFKNVFEGENPPIIFGYEFLLDEKNKKISKRKGSQSVLALSKIFPEYLLRYVVLRKPWSSLKVTNESLMEAYEKLLIEVNSYHSSTLRNRLGSPIPYLLDEERLKLPESGALEVPSYVKMIRCLSYFNLPFDEIPKEELMTFIYNRSHVFNMSARDLFHPLVKDYIETCLNYFLMIRKNNLKVHKLDNLTVKSLHRIIDKMKSNYSNDYLASYFVKERISKKILYLSLIKQQSGPKFNVLLELNSRSYLIRYLQGCAVKGSVEELLIP